MLAALWWANCFGTLCFTHAMQCQLVSDPVRLNGALDGLLLGQVRLFGVSSHPQWVKANGEIVTDFTYRSDTMVKFFFFVLFFSF